MAQTGRLRGTKGFTLLELLASVALLVVLGTLLFQIFNQASAVMRIGNGRQEIFQYAQALVQTLERELSGALPLRDASIGVASDPNNPVSRPFRVYSSNQAIQSFGRPVREGSDALSFTAALVGRDTVQTSPTYGQVAVAAHVAYWLNPADCDCILNRYESYDLTSSTQGRGWEFALNVLEFKITCLDQWQTPLQFRRMDWESASTTSTGARRGLPVAVAVTMKLTDKDHIAMYRFDATSKTMVLRDGFSIEDDPMAQEFRDVIRLRESQ